MQSTKPTSDELTLLESAEAHLYEALDEDPDADAAYHIREAAQLVIAEREL